MNRTYRDQELTRVGIDNRNGAERPEDLECNRESPNSLRLGENHAEVPAEKVSETYFKRPRPKSLTPSTPKQFRRLLPQSLRSHLVPACLS